MSETPFIDFLKSNNVETGWKYNNPSMVERTKSLSDSTKKLFLISLFLTLASFVGLLFIPYSDLMYVVMGYTILCAIVTQYTWYSYRRAYRLYWRCKMDISINYTPRNV
jgi:hypothetical protein